MSIYFSPAKVNLFFRVVSKRSDGFHEIASLFSAVDFGDYLSFQHAERDTFRTNDEELSDDESNLIIKAREVFRRSLQQDWPVSIQLIKRLPKGSGLGGGSGNAATTLWGLNEFYKRPFSQEELVDMASSIGSDVSFFFSQGLAYCTSRGEVFEGVPFPLDLEMYLAIPLNQSCSTPKVYGGCVPGEVNQTDPLEILQSFQGDCPEFVNDLVPAVERLYPEMINIREQIESLGFSSVCMTGSGSTFFCVGDVEEPSLPDIEFIRVKLLQKQSDDHWFPLVKGTDRSRELRQLTEV